MLKDYNPIEKLAYVLGVWLLGTGIILTTYCVIMSIRASGEVAYCQVSINHHAGGTVTTLIGFRPWRNDTTIGHYPSTAEAAAAAAVINCPIKLLVETEGMASRIPCFLLEPAPYMELSLRRFTFNSKPCPAHPWGHDTEEVIGREPAPLEDLGCATPAERMRQDPRWPKACLGCGYVFETDDQWQYNRNRLWQRSDNGEMVRLAAAPPGAMWDASWLPLTMASNSPDGKKIVVRTPAGDWLVDGPSTNGPGWKRTGDLPRITVRPSIAQPGYHGWLTDGVLEEI